MAKFSSEVIQVGDLKVTMLERGWDERNRGKKTRVYGAVDALVPELNAELEKWTAPAVPSVTSQFMSEQPEEAKRILQGYNKARRACTREAKKRLTALLAAAGIEAGVQGFSVYAGCSCPCSPGFILDRAVRINHAPVDIWVERVA